MARERVSGPDPVDPGVQVGSTPADDPPGDSPGGAPDGAPDGARGDPSGEDGTDVGAAAAAALARARKAARDKGLRPGLRPLRKHRPGRPDHQRSGAGRDGRDPALIGDQLDRLVSDRGWQVDVAVGAVLGRWPVIVGPEVAAHVSPVEFSDGVLVLRADSTAWATQMRLLASSLLGRLEQEVGVGTVVEVKVNGPSAPSWAKGLRRAPGRGPRDTYG